MNTSTSTSTMEPPPESKNDTSLLGCCEGNKANCCFCAMACCCPAIGYGMNYSLAVNDQRQNNKSGCACLLPCFFHGALDGLMSTIGHYATAASWLNVPLGCILRANHRIRVLPSSESYCEALLVEAFCWGCSMAEVRRMLQDKSVPYPSSNHALGLLSPPVTNSQYSELHAQFPPQSQSPFSSSLYGQTYPL